MVALVIMPLCDWPVTDDSIRMQECKRNGWWIVIRNFLSYNVECKYLRLLFLWFLFMVCISVSPCV